MNDSLKLLERYSTPARALADPAPDDKQLRLILKTAMSAPDHGRLHPYRFISIRGKARRKLSEIFGQATLDREPGVDPAYLAKQKDKPLRSPLIVVVVASLIDSPKIPEIEQMLSAGTAAHNVLLATNALGFGSIWLTGANAYDTYVCSELGIAENERIIGFIYIGTPTLDIPPRPIPEISNYHSTWS
ncbi:MAG: nitroreductase [Gammaproteobacteria bacterium]|nr:nitroreductase [Gammaproteobacteria bacterium]MCP4874252.1 nitroreductase [Gammaproteobacteria bacterium]